MVFEIHNLSIDEIKNLLNTSSGEQRAAIVELLKNDTRSGVKKIVASHQSFIKRNRQIKEDFLRLSIFESRIKEKGFRYIAGADEAGRGSLAGPLVAAAVILPNEVFIPGLKDSKQLTIEQREELYREIVKDAVAWSAEVVMPDWIDKNGLQRANLYALEQAVNNLKVTPDYVLCDGFALKNLNIPNIAIVGGDRLCASVAAASIVAKVERDHLMVTYSKEYPEYGFEKHKGYGTKEHLTALKERGPSYIHRRSFKPVAECSQLTIGQY